MSKPEQILFLLNRLQEKFVPRDDTSFGWSKQDMEGYFQLESFLYEEIPKLLKRNELRDDFAIRASEKDIEEFRGVKALPDSFLTIPEFTREEARYRFADSMLKEREKEQS